MKQTELDFNLMRVAQKYRLAKTELLTRWTLGDIFDAIEYMDIQSALDEEHRQQKDKK